MGSPEEVLEKLNRPTLYINSVPQRTKELFVELAAQEFCGHYGLALKHLLDFYVGFMQRGDEELREEIAVLKERISKLEQKEQKPAEQKRRMDGTVVE